MRQQQALVRFLPGSNVQQAKTLYLFGLNTGHSVPGPGRSHRSPDPGRKRVERTGHLTCGKVNRP